MPTAVAHTGLGLTTFRRQKMAAARDKIVMPQKALPRDEAIIFGELAELCTLPGFANAIAFFVLRDNFISFQSKLTTDDLNKLHTGNQLIRSEISTLIGLMVKQPIDYTLQEADVTQGYIEKAEFLLGELHDSLASVWFKGFSVEAVQAGFDPFSNGAAMREPIFYGGDSAYDFQYRQFAPMKYGKDQAWLESQRGFDAATAAKVSKAVKALLTDKPSAFAKTLHLKSPEQWTLLPAFTFTIDEVAARVGISHEIIERVVKAFSLPEGDINRSFTGLQEFNATNAQPILNLGSGQFVLFQHYSLDEAIYETPFFWMASDKKYAPTALKHRGEYAETLVYDFLCRVFQKCVYKNVHIYESKGSEISEIDLLVLFGDRAVVIQAKSKRLTIEARKGNDAQIKQDFQKAIQDAYDQALLCSRALLNEKYVFKDSDGAIIEFDYSPKQIFPVCVVADHYPALAFQARQFLRTQVDNVICAPLIADVFALDAMTEMLRQPLLLLSYLDLRQRHGSKILSTNELSLLSTHLKDNLWVNSRFDMVSFDESVGVHLDLAMVVRREGLPGSRTPDGILTRFQGTPLGRLMASIEADPEPTKIGLAMEILALSSSSVEAINRGIKHIQAECRRDGKNHDFTVALGDTASGLTIHCNDQPKEEAERRLSTHCAMRKYKQKASSWFGLVISPNGNARIGAHFVGDWQYDPAAEKLVREMPEGKSIKSINRMLKKKKTGRNELCPCGSGLKYKKCHLV